MGGCGKSPESWDENSMVHAPADALGLYQAFTIPEIVETVDRGEVLRYLGYPSGVAPSRRVAEMVEPWIQAAAELAAPRATYLVLPVTVKSRRVLGVQTADGNTELRGAIGEFLEPAQFVAAFVATAGAGIENRASELLGQGETLPAMIVNAVGAERAEAAEAAVIAQLKAKAAPLGLATTLPYSPGYCGMKLTEQRKLFALFDGENLGVTLTDDYLMRPLKSISGLIGLGPAEQVAAVGSPCDRCELYRCAMRR
jgi:hypothetical protein